MFFAEQLQLRRLFLSPSGAHLLAAAASGVTVYVHRSSRVGVLLQRLKPKIIECVAWGQEGSDDASATFLIGRASGLGIGYRV